VKIRQARTKSNIFTMSGRPQRTCKSIITSQPPKLWWIALNKHRRFIFEFQYETIDQTYELVLGA
jgi:hypothetical protein